MSNYCIYAKCFTAWCITTFPVTGCQQWVQMFNSCIDVDNTGVLVGTKFLLNFYMVTWFNPKDAPLEFEGLSLMAL